MFPQRKSKGTGSEPPARIRVYHSDDFKNLNDIDSGFDGPVIHLYDEEKGINQMYTIARGSEMQENDTWKPLDWAYNAFGIFVGQRRSQYRDTLEFDRKVTQKITEELKRNGQTIELKKIGLGHSLGGNHVQMIQLTEHRFDQVYVRYLFQKSPQRTCKTNPSFSFHFSDSSIRSKVISRLHFLLKL
ncbi:DUF6792 domain-containing protein [Saccharococcus caldoxylosilyticus]|uniref:DUF6792 domain-containing protein n=1 Tax=Saccharococcus caldoxylosilyticus TaxID=81408 RepID=UPI002FCD5092